ncbi:MAG: glutaredoxin family protein [Pirellulales bacterium]
MRFVLFTRRGCHLCEQAEDLLAVHRVEAALVDVDADATARERYGLRVPVLELDGLVVAEGRIDDRAVATLAAAVTGRG